jgi:hypothetical protein
MAFNADRRRRRMFAKPRARPAGVLSAALLGVVGVAAYFGVRARGRTLEAPNAAVVLEAELARPGDQVRVLGPSPVDFPDAEAPDPVVIVPDHILAAAPSAAEEAALADDPQLDEDSGPYQLEAPRRAEPKRFDTVEAAVRGSCTTLSIEGLNKQIVQQVRALSPKAFVALPSRPNLVTGPHVIPYLHVEARDRLVRVLDAHKNATMTINSALRTVAQQYMVWRWSMTKTCGVELATRPGQSNHELGLALDIKDHATWRSALEAEQFRWLGASDRVHFDYKAAEALPRKMVDVLAFQKLWNKHHPSDLIREDGIYTAATEQRLKKAPADGFPSIR